MKRLVSAVSAALLLTAAVPATASAVQHSSVVIGGAAVEYDITQSDNIIIRSVTGASGELYVPEKIDGRTVVEVGDRAFYGNPALTSINLPESVITVGKYAFAGCTSLSQATLSAHTKYIGDGAFIGCTKLYSADLGNTLTGIPSSCFSSCTSLRSVFFSDELTSIGENAFFNCPELVSIIPPTVTDIGENAFGMTVDSLTGEITAVYGFFLAGTAGSAAETYAELYGLDFLDPDSYLHGDINDDGKLDSGDASSVLKEYARISSGLPQGFTKKQLLVGDMNGDQIIDSSDASDILKEYAKISSR